MGCVSALGLTPADVFDSIIAGRTAGTDVARWHGEGLRVTSAAVVERVPALVDAEVPWSAAMGIYAARQALRDAGMSDVLADMPLVASCTIGSPGYAEPVDKNWAEMDPTSPRDLLRYSQGASVGWVAKKIGATGPVQCLMSTCAGGNYALGNALDLIESGRASAVLAGGIEETSMMVFTSFHQIRAVASVSMPFDVAREGLLFGEGAAFLVLEDEEHALARGAHVHSYVLGIGYANDAFHLVAPDRDGTGAALAITRALAEAEVGLGDVDYVNAHGTGTEANDSAELSAFRRVFGEGAPSLTLSSTKGATGHLMGAASALEAILTTLALERAVLPQTVGLKNPMPDAGVDLIRDVPRHKQAQVAVSTGFGFGGNDAALVLSRAARDRAKVAGRPVYVSGLAALTDPSTLDIEALLGKKGLRHVDRAALLWAAMLQRDLPEWPGRLAVDRCGGVFGASYPAFGQIMGILRDYQAGGATHVNPMRVPFATANCAVSWWLIRKGITGFSGAVGSGDCAGLDAVIAAVAQIERGRVESIIAGGAEGKLDELWAGLGRIGWHQLPFAEGAGALVLTAERDDAFARVVDSAQEFGPGAAERAIERILKNQRLPLVDRIVTARPLSVMQYANHVESVAELYGDSLGATSALAAVLAARHLRPPKRTAAQVLVVSDSLEGYGSALLLEAVEPLVA
jgi:3-oxoacyl-[acyl-carrier-protein] synthase II